MRTEKIASRFREFVREFGFRSRIRGRIRQRRTTGRFSAEFLEDRCLLAVTAGGLEFRVNETTADIQLSPKVAMDADGDFLVTWSSNGQDGSGSGIYALRYDASGLPTGTEFQVNTTTVGWQDDPVVAINAANDAVVVWESDDGDGGGIYAQRLSWSDKAGEEFRVNTTTTGWQDTPAVAMNAAGDFVAVWEGPDGGDQGIFAQRYNAEGLPLGGEFRVNTVTADSQSYPTVAMDASGAFVVSWTGVSSNDGTYDVYAQRYNASGVAVGKEFRVNTTTTRDQGLSSVALDASGDFVVSWTDGDVAGGGPYKVYARRFASSGVPQGAEFLVSTSTSGDISESAVAIDARGRFVVTWDSETNTGDSEILAQRYAANGVKLGAEFRVNSRSAADQVNPAVAMDAQGRFVVAWNSDGQDGDSWGVYAQRYHESNDVAGPMMAQVLEDGGWQIEPGGRLISDATRLTVVFSEAMKTQGGATGLHSVTNPANWQLIREGVDISPWISRVTYSTDPITNKREAVIRFSKPLLSGGYRLIAKAAMQDRAGNALDGNLDGVPGGNAVFAFASEFASALGKDFRVDSGRTLQVAPAVAIDDAGNYVVAWTVADFDGSGNAVVAQRFAASGRKLGGNSASTRSLTTTRNCRRSPWMRTAIS